MNVPNTLRDIANIYERIQEPTEKGAYWYNVRCELRKCKVELKNCLTEIGFKYEQSVFFDGYYNGATATTMLNQSPQK